MRIYLAGQYARKLELREYAEQAKAVGIYVGADWLEESEAPEATLDSVSDKVRSKYAQHDWWDIGACDEFVFFAEPQENQPPRGGRHVEFGMAIALGKPIVVIGQPENIFHYLPGIKIEFFDTWNSALAYLISRSAGE
jgi:nucleoside 2-deoxyribosyltransferase